MTNDQNFDCFWVKIPVILQRKNIKPEFWKRN